MLSVNVKCNLSLFTKFEGAQLGNHAIAAVYEVYILNKCSCTKLKLA